MWTIYFTTGKVYTYILRFFQTVVQASLKDFFRRRTNGGDQKMYLFLFRVEDIDLFYFLK